MNNNDILRRIRYIFDFNDTKMITVFRSADTWVTREQVSDWLKKEDNPAYRELNDEMLAVFLDGLISEKRGQKSGSMRTPETRLTNNIIFDKLKIALNLRSEDILALLDLADFRLGKSELKCIFSKTNSQTLSSLPGSGATQFPDWDAIEIPRPGFCIVL